jgi:HSP20 family molecular chaperone IbpA
MKMAIIRNPNLYASSKDTDLLRGPGPPDPFSVEDLTNCRYPWPDLIETDNDYVLRIDMPGEEKEYIDIWYGAGRLSVVAHRSDAGGIGLRNHQRESSNERFTCMFALPGEIEAQIIWSELREDVLSVHLPKGKPISACRSLAAVNSEERRKIL